MDRDSVKKKNLKTRSETMRAVRSHGNKSTEIILEGILRELGKRSWSSHVRSLIGCPDFVFNRKKTAIFVDGCFWHACKKCYRRPSTSQEYWDKKIIRNKHRDKKVNKELRLQGWKVIRVWEHQLKAPSLVKNRLRKVL